MALEAEKPIGSRYRNPACSLGYSQFELRFSAWQTYVATLAVGALSLVLFLAAAEDWELSRRADPVFGASTRIVLCTWAILQLAACVAVFLTQNRFVQILLLLWLGLSHVVYRLGLAWLNASTPLVILRVIGMKVGIHARVLDTVWKCFMVYLVVSSLVVLVLEWRLVRRQRAATYLAQWEARRKAQASQSIG